MIHRVIVLEEDRALADRIIWAFRNNGIDTATVVASMREARQKLSNLSHNLALIPYEYLGNPLHTLSRIDPEIRFILTVKSSGNKETARFEEPVIGVV